MKLQEANSLAIPQDLHELKRVLWNIFPEHSCTNPDYNPEPEEVDLVDWILRNYFQNRPLNLEQAVFIRTYAYDLLKKGDFYMARELFQYLGETERLLPAMETWLDHENEANYEFMIVAIQLGTVKQIDEALRRYGDVLSADPHWNPDGLCIREFSDLNMEVYKLYQEYARHERLPTRGGNFLTTTNAAVELSNYDCVVNVATSGGEIPNKRKLLGHPTACVEWHKDWKVPARFRHSISDMQALSESERILLCDNDAVEGTTMRNCIAAVRKKTQAVIDVCFTGMYYEKSVEAIRSLDVDDIFHAAELPYNHLYSNTLLMKEMLLKWQAANIPNQYASKSPDQQTPVVVRR